MFSEANRYLLNAIPCEVNIWLVVQEQQQTYWIFQFCMKEHLARWWWAVDTVCAMLVHQKRCRSYWWCDLRCIKAMEGGVAPLWVLTRPICYDDRALRDMHGLWFWVANSSDMYPRWEGKWEGDIDPTLRQKWWLAAAESLYN